MNTPHAHSGVRFHGFTLIELLVTVVITSIMLLVVNQVFTTVSAAVGVGMATSELLTNTRPIGDQFREDFEAMLGPGDNGYMIIVNNEQSNQKILLVDDETGFDRNVRDDQIMFFRNATGMTSLTPSADGTFDPQSFSPDASAARIWYGHALRTNSDGTLTAPTGLGHAPNKYASDWILARQAALLDAAADANDWYAENCRWTATVVNVTTDITDPQLRDSLTDVVRLDLFGTSDADGVVGGTGTPGTETNIVWEDDTPDDYYDRARRNGFVNGRLRLNPVPDGTTFESWRIAQMHPYFAGHVSDFIVEFAGDYDGDGDVDTVSGGAILWYGMQAEPPIDANGFVSPTSSETDTMRPLYAKRGSPGVSLPTTADRIFVFRHGSSAKGWPHLVRIRYRLHDSRDKIVGADGEAGRWFEYVLKVNR
jgi:prepilin-type N-terminal cleavage/methylation domain-containing protein